MLILVAFKSVLEGTTAVSSRLQGGIWISAVGQDTVRPNILLELIGGGQDYSHQGANGLIDAGVRVFARGDTVDAAALLGEAIVGALQDYVGTAKGCQVQLTEHMSTVSDYDDGAKLFLHVSEYTAFYRKV